jgi:hypothetical protein
MVWLYQVSIELPEMSILNNCFWGKVKTVFQHVAQRNPQHKNHDFGIFCQKWGALARYNVSKKNDVNQLLASLINDNY